MASPESTLFVLLLILSIALIVPELFKKLRVPMITSIIIIGSILGPNGFNSIQVNEVISFFGFLGMTFLMLMAGLETNISKLSKLKNKIFIMAILNGLIPFIVGVSITRYFNYSWTASLLIGTIFISSSVALIVPSLRSAGLFNKNIGQLILSSILITDIISLLVLSLILQTTAPITKLPLPVYYIILAFSIMIIYLYTPKLIKFLFQKEFTHKTYYEDQLRLVIVIVMAVLAYFSFLGVHPILAAFIVGLTLSHTVKHEIILTKIHTLGYGFFVPIFFFIVGMEMDLKILKGFDIKNLVMVLIILGLISSKFISGFIAGKIVRLPKKDSIIFGTSSIIQLTTTLAVTYAASSLGILDSILVSSIIMLSIITTILGPILLKYISTLRLE